MPQSELSRNQKPAVKRAPERTSFSKPLNTWAAGGRTPGAGRGVPNGLTVTSGGPVWSSMYHSRYSALSQKRGRVGQHGSQPVGHRSPPHTGPHGAPIDGLQSARLPEK